MKPAVSFHRNILNEMNISTGKKKKIGWLLLTVTTLFFLTILLFLGGKYMKYKQLQNRLPDLDCVHTDPVCNERNFTDKIWIHRMDSKERFRILPGKYKGIEMDLMYDSVSNNFDVRHPPAESTGFSLEDAFAATPNITGHYFWLDYKNLTEQVKFKSCAKLLALAKKYNISQNIIVESQEPEPLTYFTESRFYTSYYLPVFNIASSSKDEIKMYYNEVKKRLQNSKVCALSGNYQQLPFIEKYFPDKDIVTWYLNEDRGLKYSASLFVLTRNPKVKVILVAEMSEGYR